MNAIPTRPSAYTVALSSHQNTSGVAACSKPTTTPHNIGARRARAGAGEVIAERDKVWRPSAMRVHPLVNARLDATAAVSSGWRRCGDGAQHGPDQRSLG